MDLHTGRPLDPDEVAFLLMEARERTLLLVAPLTEEDLRRIHDPIMSPIVWDLGHIAHFEEVWLLENLEEGRGGGGGREGLRGIYDPFKNPRAVRGELDLPSGDQAREYLGAVRGAVLRHLEHLDLNAAEGASPLLRDGFVFRMVLQHEYQHGETILQTLQLKAGEPYRAPRGIQLPEPRFDPLAHPGAEEGMVRFSGGEVEIGTDDRSVAYDNERSRHRVRLDPFWIDVAPVSNRDYLEFVEEGGYERMEFWSPAGRAWLEESGARAPEHWIPDRGGWSQRVMDLRRPLDPERPVCHVSYYEAEAYARFRGKRLPTEEEWEAAAAWDPSSGSSRVFPWGDAPPTPSRANLDQLAFDTAPIGAYPENVSPIGCYGMVGDVWEWTSSDFRGYPGFEAFPYPEYSEVFFGEEYKVLRGGSWATRAGAIRNTFRNWDFPIRRQIYAGLRCARSES